MRVRAAGSLTENELQALSGRGTVRRTPWSLLAEVRTVMDPVVERGDDALVAATLRIDGVALASERLRVSAGELRASRNAVPAALKEALDAFVSATVGYNRKIMPAEPALAELDGVTVGRLTHPIERVGLFVPYGKASYPSTLVTIAVPAVVAGVPHLSLLIPPRRDGGVDAAFLYVADVLGIEHVYRANGVAGIAALAAGTQRVPAVDLIVGPGSPAIMAAQLYAQMLGTATYPCFGPTECLVLADHTARPDWIAADLLTELEHGPDSSAIVVSPDRALLEAVIVEVAARVPTMPRRGMAEAALKHSVFLHVRDLDEGVALVNHLGNEHVQIACLNAEAVARRIRHAAEILIGQFTPFASIAYGVGVPSCLPTGTHTRSRSGVTVDTFLQHSAVVSLTPAALSKLAGPMRTLAEAENLPQHAAVVMERLPGSV